MLEIIQRESSAGYEKYIPDDCKSPLLIESRDGARANGFALFEYRGGIAVIHAIGYENGDLALCDGIIRTVFLKASAHSVCKAMLSFGGKAKRDCEKLGFDDVCDIGDYLGGCEHCKSAQKRKKATQKQNMLAGLPYKDDGDELEHERQEARKKCYEFNCCPPFEREKLAAMIKGLFGKTGQRLTVEPPFHCDYGYNIEVGENFYANFNCTMLDVVKIEIGDNCFLAPNVSFYTASHPVHSIPRNIGLESGAKIRVGDNVWIGGSVTILPGVSIGSNCVIGAGSVVTRNIPANSIAVGNPCRVVRQITDEDIAFYYKDIKF